MTAEAGVRIGERAAALVLDGMDVGLGTGRAAAAFVRALGRRVASERLRVRGVPTSDATARLAEELSIPLVALDAAPVLDLTVDGADEVDPSLDVIKGYGGALVREKIVASASRRLVLLVGAEKLVPVLGTRGRLPIEAVPFGVAVVRRKLEELGLPAVERPGADGRSARSDNGNAILDVTIAPLPDAAETAARIRAIPGVVDTGLFLGMADLVLVEHPDGVEELRRRPD